MKIVKIEPYTDLQNPTDFVDVYDITVANTHLYSLAAGIVVSNSKRVSLLDVNALLSHGATETLRDAGVMRGQKNEDLWMQFMSGNTPGKPRVPTVYEKFVNQLKSAGINVVRDGYQTRVMALTRKDVDTLAGDREILTGDTVRFDKALKPVKGGLFDEHLTGGHAGKKWSYIKLPEPLPNPVMEEPIRRILGLTGKQYEAVLSGEHEVAGFGTGPEAIAKALDNLNLDKEINIARAQYKSGKASARDAAVRKWGYLKSAKDLDLHPREWVLDKVPVLPPAFRPVSVMGEKGIPLIADANYMYKELLDAKKNYTDLEKHVGAEGLGNERLAMYHAFKAVAGLGDPVHPKLIEKGVTGVLKSIFGTSPKYGTVQRKLISSTVDSVGRGVITPNPDYDMDTVGLPEDKAFDVYRKALVRRLKRGGMPIRDALHHIKERTPLARETLLEEMEKRPVFINRAPVLHKFGIMAFRPKLVQGTVIQLSPLVVGGFNADFDGDNQINRVLLALPKDFTSDINIGTVYPNLLKESVMPFDSELNVPTLSGHDLYCVDLSDFPHGRRLKTTRGQFGSIDWYSVPADVKVLSYDSEAGKASWQQATVWSVHHDCPVTLVNLKSGRQIITDDDPRAVYGIAPRSLKLTRSRPADAVGFSVPRLRRLKVKKSEVTITELDTGRWLQDSFRMRLVPKITLDEEFGYLLGTAVGDGWVPELCKDFCVAGITDEIIAKVDSAIQTLFIGDGPTYCLQTNVESYGESRRATWTSRHLAEMVAELVGQKAECKQLPPFFLSAPREFRLGLLAGLMDTDGSISISNGKAKPQLMSNISSRSLRLLREAGLLLWSLGIHSRITTSKTPAGKPFWVLSITNSDIKNWNGRGMVHPKKLAALASVETLVESPASARQDMVPISWALATALCGAMTTPKDRTKWPEGQGTVYTTLSKSKTTGRLSRFTAKQVKDFIPVDFTHEDYPFWQKIIADETITWDEVESFEDTGKVETGYDLTVPGLETFTAVDGVVLSNTMQFHVPGTDEAVKEAYERLLPSRSLLSPSDFKSPVHKPGQQYMAGLYHATRTHEKDKKKRERVFRSKEEAIAAYKRGEISADTDVSILE